MSNITLSAGIRQNLLSLQDTAANLTTTQEHLSTGKKINTAFDNPTSYFTSQSLNNRANDLSALLDQIGQGQQTLDAANNGLTSLTSLLEQALSTAQQAQQTTPTAAAVSTGSVALTSLNAGANLLINVGANTYTVAITASEALSSIESQINAVSGLGANGAVTASDDGSGHLVLTGNTNTTAFTVVANAESAALGVTTSATVNNAVAPVSATRTTLQGNYNNILTQIDQLAGDASYNGINLLAGDTLKVLFNENGTSSLTIAGVNFNSKGLGLSAASGTGFLDNNNITADGNGDQCRNLRRACPDRDVRHQLGHDPDPSDVREEHDQHPADGCQQPGVSRSEPGKRQPADVADAAAIGNLGAIHRQPGEPVGPEVVPIIRSGAGLRKAAGRKPRRPNYCSPPPSSKHENGFCGWAFACRAY